MKILKKMFSPNVHTE